jgi:hypothetical protein
MGTESLTQSSEEQEKGIRLLMSAPRAGSCSCWHFLVSFLFLITWLSVLVRFSFLSVMQNSRSEEGMKKRKIFARVVHMVQVHSRFQDNECLVLKEGEKRGREKRTLSLEPDTSSGSGRKQERALK